MSTRRRSVAAGWGPIATGTAAVFGVLVSACVAAVVVAGFLQWGPQLPRWLDNAAPLLVLCGGMVLCGRVAVDMAGRGAVWVAVGTALLVAGLGLAVSVSGEAHGDGLEPLQVAYAVGVVLLVVAGTALLIQRRREL